MTLPTLSQNQDSALRKLDRAIEIFITVMFACAILLTCCSCGTSKHVTQLVRDVRVDTVYLSNMQYDSIYIYKDRYQDRSRDTVYLKDVSLEVRYKLLRDTVKVIQRDSIPYQVTVTEVKEITRPLTWYDHLTRFSFWLVVGAFLSFVAFKLKSVFKR